MVARSRTNEARSEAVLGVRGQIPPTRARCKQKKTSWKSGLVWCGNKGAGRLTSAELRSPGECVRIQTKLMTPLASQGPGGPSNRGICEGRSPPKYSKGPEGSSPPWRGRSPKNKAMGHPPKEGFFGISDTPCAPTAPHARGRNKHKRDPQGRWREEGL